MDSPTIYNYSSDVTFKPVSNKDDNNCTYKEYYMSKSLCEASNVVELEGQFNKTIIKSKRYISLVLVIKYKF